MEDRAVVVSAVTVKNRLKSAKPSFDPSTGLVLGAVSSCGSGSNPHFDPSISLVAWDCLMFSSLIFESVSVLKC